MRSFTSLLPLLFLFLLFGIYRCGSSSGGKQLVATMQPEDPIEGVCNMDKIYVMLPTMDGQVQAEPPVELDTIQKRMNQELDYLEEHPSHNDSGMVSLVINCKGELVQVEMDGNNRTKSEELDAQIVEVFEGTEKWSPAEYHGRAVDSSRLITFLIEEGRFRFD